MTAEHTGRHRSCQGMVPPGRASVRIVALTAPALQAFPDRYADNRKGRQWISPPPAEARIQDQSGEGRD